MAAAGTPQKTQRRLVDWRARRDPATLEGLSDEELDRLEQAARSALGLAPPNERSEWARLLGLIEIQRALRGSHCWLANRAGAGR